jgi:hypothetical protein
MHTACDFPLWQGIGEAVLFLFQVIVYDHGLIIDLRSMAVCIVTTSDFFLLFVRLETSA